MTAALVRLREVDAVLDERVVRLSLAPDRERATTLFELGTTLGADLEPSLARALHEGLARVSLAIAEEFPDNVFWDLDYLFFSLVREALTTADPVAFLDTAVNEVVALHALFGRHTTIHFRYVHDFVYGYDWAKWVSRDPAARPHVRPFDLEFLRSMHTRGRELVALIDANDTKYPRLAPGEPRNPFGFSRSPSDERLLLQELSVRGLLPLEAWRVDPPLVWNRPYADERAQTAARLLG